MKIKFIKAGLDFADRLGRRSYNSDPPPVRAVVRGIRYGEDAEQELDVIVPLSDGPHKVLVHIHGGGWLMGHKDSYTRICRSIAQDGVLVFNLNYRLVPRHTYPAQLQDIAQAIIWVADNAHRYGGDPRQIYLMGDSAGAQLALWYATALASPELQQAAGIGKVIEPEQIRGLLLFYGVYEVSKLASAFGGQGGMLAEAFLGKDPEMFATRNRTASPIYHLHPGLPPIFICCGMRDTLYPQSVDLTQALAGIGVQHESLLLDSNEYPEAIHGFFNFHRRKASVYAMQKAREFLARVG